MILTIYIIVFIMVVYTAILLKKSDPYFYNVILNIIRLVVEFFAISLTLAVIVGIVSAFLTNPILLSPIIPDTIIWVSIILAWIHYRIYDGKTTKWSKFTGDYQKFSKKLKYGDV